MRENVIYGYARCSTSEELQDIKRQKRELKKLGVTDNKNIYFEYISGTERKREELEKLMSIVQKNDIIVVTEVSRLTRSTSHLCEILEWIKINKLCLVIDTFKVDCRGEIIDPLTKGMLMMWGVFAEMERDIISQRVKSGIENAKEKRAEEKKEQSLFWRRKVQKSLRQRCRISQEITSAQYWQKNWFWNM